MLILYAYNSFVLRNFATNYNPNSAALAMKAFLFIIVSLLASVSTMAQNTKFDIEADLQLLYSVVANSANYDRQKQQNINLIKRSMGAYVTPMKRYNYYKRLYDEYMKFDSDFAKHYASLCQKVASRADMPNLELMSICI